MNTSNSIRKTLAESGLTPESCAQFLSDDLEMFRNNFNVTKNLMDENTRVQQEIVLLKRELLLIAIRKACLVHAAVFFFFSL